MNKSLCRIYVRNDVESYHINNYSHNCECVCACLVGVRLLDRALVIAGVYRSPALELSDPGEFISEDSGRIVRAAGSARDLVWLSDSNVELSQNGDLEGDLLNKMAKLGLEWVPTGWARRGSDVDTGTTIDHVFVRSYGHVRVTARSVVSGEVSDHEMIGVQVDLEVTSARPNEPNSKHIRTDWHKFRKRLEAYDVNEILAETDRELVVDRA